MTINPVETRKPTVPEVKSDRKIDSKEFTATFPSRIAQRRRLPLFLRG
jgi:hypothetical protein